MVCDAPVMLIYNALSIPTPYSGRGTGCRSATPGPFLFITNHQTFTRRFTAWRYVLSLQIDDRLGDIIGRRDYLRGCLIVTLGDNQLHQLGRQVDVGVL